MADKITKRCEKDSNREYPETTSEYTWHHHVIKCMNFGGY
jgi:hypothetical protein